MEEINLIEIINLFLRKWWLIVILMLIGGAATYMYTDFFVDVTYKSDASFYVNTTTELGEDSSASLTGLNTNTRLALSVAEILTRRNFLEKVAIKTNDTLGTSYTWNSIQSMLTVEPVNETEILELSVTGSNQEALPVILGYVMDLAPSTVMQVINGASLEVVDRPSEDPTRVGPNITRNSLLGVVGGFVLAALIIFLIELFDTHIKTSDDLKQKYPEPVLGEIPTLDPVEV